MKREPSWCRISRRRKGNQRERSVPAHPKPHPGRRWWQEGYLQEGFI